MLLDKGVNDGLAALEVSQAEGVGAVDQDPVGSQGVGAVPPPAVVIGGYGANAASGLHHPLLLSRPGEAVQCSTTPSLMRCDLDSCVSTGLGGAVRNRGYGVAHWRRLAPTRFITKGSRRGSTSGAGPIGSPKARPAARQRLRGSQHRTDHVLRLLAA